jgi:hypothetical protein
MRHFSWRRSVCALVVTLGLTITSCVLQRGNPKGVSPDSRSLTVTEPAVAPKATIQAAYGKFP